MPKICGVYQILNTVTGKCYIGKSENVQARWCKHLRELRQGIHHAQKLQRAWNKYGESVFTLAVLLECPKDDLIEEEDKAIQSYDAYHKGYNGTLKAGRDATGVKRTPEFCKAISDRTRGRVLSEAAKEKLRQINLGRPCPEWVKLKLSQVHKGHTYNLGKKHSEATRKKMSDAHQGHEVSQATRDKISAKHKGKAHGPMPQSQRDAIKAGVEAFMEANGGAPISSGFLGKTHSEESRRKISEAQKGKVIPEESRKRMSEAKQGKPGHSMSAEAKEKIRQARIAYWAAKKKE